jgi:hypothetical protein
VLLDFCCFIAAVVDGVDGLAAAVWCVDVLLRRSSFLTETTRHRDNTFLAETTRKLALTGLGGVSLLRWSRSLSVLVSLVCGDVDASFDDSGLP